MARLPHRTPSWNSCARVLLPGQRVTPRALLGDVPRVRGPLYVGDAAAGPTVSTKWGRGCVVLTAVLRWPRTALPLPCPCPAPWRPPHPCHLCRSEGPREPVTRPHHKPASPWKEAGGCQPPAAVHVGLEPDDALSSTGQAPADCTERGWVWGATQRDAGAIIYPFTPFTPDLLCDRGVLSWCFQRFKCLS